MADLWNPRAVRELATSNAGAMTGGAPKAVLHTTEGHRYTDALATYRARGFWPSATITYDRGRVDLYQHLPANLAAKALERRSGAGATNTDNVQQLEIVGSADPAKAAKAGLLYVEDFPDEYLAGIADWLAWCRDAAGVPMVAPFPFGPKGTTDRASWPQWHATAGVYGHCHVPANSHFDPGPIPIGRILELANGGTQPMPLDPQVDNIVRICRRLTGGRWELGSDGGVFAEAGAPFYGSMGGQHLNAPMVAIVPTPSEAGYWLVGADGGIFAFGDAFPIAPYEPLFHEYQAGARRIVDAAPHGPALELVSNRGEEYEVTAAPRGVTRRRPKRGLHSGELVAARLVMRPRTQEEATP